MQLKVPNVISATICLLTLSYSTERVTPFDPIVHANDAGYATTRTTRSYFAEDIDLYIFGIEYGLVDLQQHMSSKLCSYPVYASEIVMLINNLYSTTSKVTQQVDPDLANFIADRIQCFRHQLIADAGVLAALRACIPPKMELEHLSRHASISDKTVDAALHALRDAISEPNTTGALLQIFERKHLSSTTPALKSPNMPLRPAHARRNSDNPLYDRTADAVTTLTTIGERRVVRAEQDGRGTLRSNANRRFSVPPPIVRNEDFRVARGQYLVLLPEQRPQVHGVNARVVCNEAGEVGELFENLRLTAVQDNQSELSSFSTVILALANVCCSSASVASAG